jgi:hypothetical protein
LEHVGNGRISTWGCAFEIQSPSPTLGNSKPNIVYYARFVYTQWKLAIRNVPPMISGPKLAALGAAGVVGIAQMVAIPYAMLGVVEVAGLTATELTVIAGLLPVAGYGGRPLLGATVLGTTAALVDDGAKPSDMSLTTAEAREDYSLSAQGPISAWRKW